MKKPEPMLWLFYYQSLNAGAQNSATQSQQQQSVDTVASAMNELHASNQEVANSAQ
ncbi:hypothetical protein [Vibrio hangzhouensis]|uniref:hypothetical protein n=1 Tax=Vibrio hangzhouensis TaxID=462991 RepID=UPI001C952AC0|nr:hypothetical protein [Vibrio hangzhouensis]MBY6199061.1 hypothetical protein [Vibrio hangzhouensis]